jgi:hypothetical protein
MSKGMTFRRPIAVPLFVVLCLVAGWWWFTRILPNRPPDLTGKVLSVSQEGDDVLFVVRLSVPTETGDSYLVRAAEDAHIRHRRGGTGEIVAGQAVSVWHYPGVQFGIPPNPPSVRAEWVVIEPLQQ